MTEISVINTGSSGNGYKIKSGGQILILELGCKFMDYINTLEDEIRCVAGCCASHAHSDHLNKSTAKEFLRRGVPVYAHANVIADSGLDGFSPVLSRVPFLIGAFVVQTFEAPHNVPNYGFLITTPGGERIVFVTDTTGVNLRFKNIDCIMVECNHDDDTLLENLDRHEVSMSHPEYHLGLNDCAEFCRQNASTSTKQIILIHMSHANINEERAVATVKERTHFDNVSVAHSGDIFTFDNDSF